MSRSDYQKERRNRLVAQGFCSNCLKNPATEGPRGGHYLCDVCREKDRTRPSRQRMVEQTRKQREKWKAESRCIYCGKPAVVGQRGGTKMCEHCIKHWESTRSDRRNRMVATAIYGGACENCGLADVRMLQFHHVNGGGRQAALQRGEKEGTRLMRLIAKSGERNPELALLCANCHLLRHWDDRWDPDWKAFGGIVVPTTD